MNTNPKTAFRRNILLALGWNVMEFNQGVAEYAKKANWILNDIMCHNGRVPSQWNGDGIITHITESSEKALLSLLRRAKVPVVNLGSYTSSIVQYRVMADNLRIGEMAAEHLLDRGFEHFAFYHVNSHLTVRERMEGYRNTVLAAHKQFHEIDLESKLPADIKLLTSTQYSRLLGRLATQLKKLPKPLAAMAQYDAEANDIVRACFIANLRIPEDVAVIGVDNDPVYSTLGPLPLTTVESNRRLTGYRAAELLDQILDGNRWIEKTVRIAPEGVIVRMSTDLVAVEDPHISKALRFIWSRFKEDISVEDVIHESGISRRSLYGRFEKVVGHPIHKEIMNRRLEHAKLLLRETDRKLQFVADESGLGDAERLSKTFRRHCGVSPLDYRMKHQTAHPAAESTQ